MTNTASKNTSIASHVCAPARDSGSGAKIAAVPQHAGDDHRHRQSDRAAPAAARRASARAPASPRRASRPRRSRSCPVASSAARSQRRAAQSGASNSSRHERHDDQDLDGRHEHDEQADQLAEIDRRALDRREQQRAQRLGLPLALERAAERQRAGERERSPTGCRPPRPGSPSTCPSRTNAKLNTTITRQREKDRRVRRARGCAPRRRDPSRDEPRGARGRSSRAPPPASACAVALAQRAARSRIGRARAVTQTHRVGRPARRRCSKSCVAMTTIAPEARSARSRATQQRRRLVVEARERLVEQHEPRTVHERALEREPLPQPAREARHAIVGAIGSRRAAASAASTRDPPDRARRTGAPKNSRFSRADEVAVEEQVVAEHADARRAARRRTRARRDCRTHVAATSAASAWTGCRAASTSRRRSDRTGRRSRPTPHAHRDVRERAAPAEVPRDVADFDATRNRSRPPPRRASRRSRGPASRRRERRPDPHRHESGRPA